MFKGQYGSLESHQSMIQDEYRTQSYIEAIRRAVKEDDVVIDFGSGSGLLAMVAAQTAKKVYAIERNREAAKMLLTNLERNEIFNVEICVCDAHEFMEKYPNLKADLVISECIGDHLFENSMVIDFLKLVEYSEAQKQIPSRFQLMCGDSYIRRKQKQFDKQKTYLSSVGIDLDLMTEDNMSNPFLDVAYFEDESDEFDQYFKYEPMTATKIMDFTSKSELEPIVRISLKEESFPGDYLMLCFRVFLYEDIEFDNLPWRPNTGNHSYYQRVVNVGHLRTRDYILGINYYHDEIGSESGPNKNIFVKKSEKK